MNVLARNTALKSSDAMVIDPIRDSHNGTQPRVVEPQPTTFPRPYAGPSIISSVLTIVGKLESTEDIQIDGNVEGEIRGQAVRIGTGAVIKGTVTGEVVELAGTVEGKIEARAVTLAKNARMTGDIIYQSLQIDQGAYFNGNSRPHHGKNPPGKPD